MLSKLLKAFGIVLACLVFYAGGMLILYNHNYNHRLMIENRAKAKSELENFYVANQAQPIPSPSVSLQTLNKAKSHHLNAQLFGAKPDDELFLDIEEKISAYESALSKKAKSQIDTHLAVPYDNFSSKASKAHEKWNNFFAKTPKKKK